MKNISSYVMLQGDCLLGAVEIDGNVHNKERKGAGAGGYHHVLFYSIFFFFFIFESCRVVSSKGLFLISSHHSLMYL